MPISKSLASKFYKYQNMDFKTKILLGDILESIESVETYLGKDEDLFTIRNNPAFVKTLKREIETVSSTMSRLVKADPEIAINNKERIIHLPNKFIEGMEQSDDEIVWETIIRQLQALKKDVTGFLKKHK